MLYIYILYYGLFIYIYAYLESEVKCIILYMYADMVKLLSMFHLHCNCVNLWRMAKQSSRYALEEGLRRCPPLAVWRRCQPLFQKGLGNLGQGSHPPASLSNQPTWMFFVMWDEMFQITKVPDFHQKLAMWESGNSLLVNIRVFNYSDWLVSCHLKKEANGCWLLEIPPKLITNHKYKMDQDGPPTSYKWRHSPTYNW